MRSLKEKPKKWKLTFVCLSKYWDFHYVDSSRMWRGNKFALTHFRGSSPNAHSNELFPQSKSITV